MTLLVKAAALYATEKHKNQMYGEFPYTKHLSDVSGVLSRFGTNREDLHAAAWLHDSVEDTDAKIEEIRMIFGEAVSDLVGRVTNEPGKNRKERHEKTYPKIKASLEATMLKLADRIANVESCIRYGDKRIEMYKKEHNSFKEQIKTPNTFESMWKHLDFLIGEA